VLRNTNFGLARPGAVRLNAPVFAPPGSPIRCLGIVATSLMGSALFANVAFAEGGYFGGQNGARAAGRSGAFAARADDLGAMMFNPAGLADLDGTMVQLANQLSYNTYSYTRAPTLDYGKVPNGDGTYPTATFASVHNQRPWQPVLPMLGVASRLGLSNWTFALAAFAPSGIGTEQYPEDGGQRFMLVKREAIILSYAASAAWRHGEVFGIGATAQWIHVPRLVYSLEVDGSRSPGEINPVSSPVEILATINGSDPMTLNAIAGAWVRPTPAFEVAVSGQFLPAKIVAHSTLSLQPKGSELGKLTVGPGANDVTVTLPLPLLARVAARYRHLVAGLELFDLELDVEYETWSRVNRFTVDAHHLRVDYGGDHIFIDQIQIDKQWQDTVAVKLGGDYAAVPGRLTLRAGAFYVTPVAPLAYTSLDFSTAARRGGSVGASLSFGRVELSVAYQLRVQPTVHVAESDGRVYQQVPGSACTAPYTDTETCSSHTLGTPGPVVNAGTYQAASHLVLLDLIYRFRP
jgi:long-chain fatty acid transport protein